MTAILWLLIVALMLRWVLAAWTDRGGPRLPPASDAELARLRAEVDELNREVRRLSEEQSFMVRLLSEGERRPPPLPGEAPPPEDPRPGDV